MVLAKSAEIVTLPPFSEPVPRKQSIDGMGRAATVVTIISARRVHGCPHRGEA